MATLKFGFYTCLVPVITRPQSGHKQLIFSGFSGVLLCTVAMCELKFCLFLNSLPQCGHNLGPSILRFPMTFLSSLWFSTIFSLRLRRSCLLGKTFFCAGLTSLTMESSELFPILSSTCSAQSLSLSTLHLSKPFFSSLTSSNLTGRSWVFSSRFGSSQLINRGSRRSHS